MQDPWVGKIPGEGNGNPLQYSCLENSMDGGAWQATVHRIANSRTRLSDFITTTSGKAGLPEKSGPKTQPLILNYK